MSCNSCPLEEICTLQQVFNEVEYIVDVTEAKNRQDKHDAVVLDGRTPSELLSHNLNQLENARRLEQITRAYRTRDCGIAEFTERVQCPGARQVTESIDGTVVVAQECGSTQRKSRLSTFLLETARIKNNL